MGKSINYNAILERLAGQADKLNDWEIGFIESVTLQNYDYTDKQKEIIIKINRKLLSG